MADDKTAATVDLSPIAGGVAVVRRRVHQAPGVTKLPNPFEKIVRESYNTAWTDEDGTEYEHGEPRITAPLRADSEEEGAVLRALTRAGRNLGYSVPRSFTDTDAAGNKIRKPNRAIVFQAVDLVKRERKPKNGDQAPEGEQAPGLWEGDHQHGDYPDHSHPASNDEHAHAKRDDGSADEPAKLETEGEQAPEGDQGEQNPEGEQGAPEGEQTPEENREPAWS